MDLGLKDKVAVDHRRQRRHRAGGGGGPRGRGRARRASRRATTSGCRRRRRADRQGIRREGGRRRLRRRDRRGCDALIAATQRKFGGADILINNAGTGSNETIMEAPDEKWQYYWDLHVMAAVRLARGLVPSMKKRGGGVILHNASICAVQPLWYEPIYNVTKAALMMFSKTLANEVVEGQYPRQHHQSRPDPDARLDQDGEAADRRQGRRLGGLSPGRRRRARADQALRHARGAGATSSSSSARTRRAIRSARPISSMAAC